MHTQDDNGTKGLVTIKDSGGVSKMDEHAIDSVSPTSNIEELATAVTVIFPTERPLLMTV